MPKRIQILAFLLLALTIGVASGDTPEDLQKLRVEFDARIAKTGESQLRLYLKQLEELERTLVSEGNYTGAIQTRDEADSVRNQIARMTSDSPVPAGGTNGPKTPELIKFLPRTAEVSGTVWDQESDSLSGWRTNTDFARWQLPNLPPGGYEVILEYQTGSLESGNFVISEKFFQLSGQIESTGGKLARKNFGTLKIRSGQDYLTLRATRTDIGGLMQLKSIELVPAWR